MAENNVLRLYPLPSRQTSPKAIYEDLALPPAECRDPSRPYVLINMVSSLDGRTTVKGKAARIGSEIDRQVMRTLRSKADAVMIGANTLRAERLSLGLDDPADSRQPLAVIVSSTGSVPLEDNLIGSERQSILVLTTQRALDERLRGRARMVRVPATPQGDVDLAEALKILNAEYAVDLLLVEGGPTLNYALISDDLANELFLTLAPKLLGQGLAVINSPALMTRDIHLLCVHLAGDELFLRYSLRPLQPK